VRGFGDLLHRGLRASRLPPARLHSLHRSAVPAARIRYRTYEKQYLVPETPSWPGPLLKCQFLLQDLPTPGGSLRFAHRGLISSTPPACKSAARKGCADISRHHLHKRTLKACEEIPVEQPACQEGPLYDHRDHPAKYNSPRTAAHFTFVIGGESPQTL